MHVLVDPRFPFKVVYAAYHHEYLGYLLSAHYVQVLQGGELSLVHHGAIPENMGEFASGLDDKDRQLIRLMAEILPRNILKKFGGEPRKELEFFTQKYVGEARNLIESFIQRRLAQLMPLLEDRLVFEMGNDSYPAQRPIRFLTDKASIRFRVRRGSDGTYFQPVIRLRGHQLILPNTTAIILCHTPAWMLYGGELFTFDMPVEGKRLVPFLKKAQLHIPPDKEPEFYEKFIRTLVEKYPVDAEGFSVEHIREVPQFMIVVRPEGANNLAFVRQVRYGRFEMGLEAASDLRAMHEDRDGWMVFSLIHRDKAREEEIGRFLDGIAPNPGTFLAWEGILRDEGLAWLATHSEALQKAGVSLIQAAPDMQINFIRPEIDLITEDKGDWFGIRAMVRIGDFEIPFIRFRSNILQNKREFKLPDGTIAILPEQWFTDYRHLLEVSEVNGDDYLRIQKYQAPLLYFPSQNNVDARMAEALKQSAEIPPIAPPANLQAELRKYQLQGYSWLNYMKERQMGCILADDMGLGKTLQTIALLQREKESGVNIPSLIVMPTSLIHNWRNEVQRFAPDLDIYIHTGIGRTRDLHVFSGFDLILTTYGIVRQDIGILRQFPFHYVILDESQMIKNPESKTSQAVRLLVSRYRMSLTGTPIENTVMDIWSQMSFLNPGLLGSESFFKTFYVTPIEKEKDNRQSAKLRRIIYPFILRRRKHQVEQDLPPRVENIHYCEMTEKQKAYYEEVRSSYRNYLLDLISRGVWKQNKLNILTGLQKLRQIAIHPQLVDKEGWTLADSGKYAEVKRLLHSILDNKRSKVLIFSQFVKMLDILRADLSAEGIRFNYLDGSTRDRQGQVDSFQRDKDIQVFLISLKAGGVGLNLTAADYVFILDPWWNPAVENQAIDRSHRIGQKRTVFYYKFITEESIEEKILSLQRSKAQLSDDIISLEEDVYKSLEADDLDALLQ
ncbi:MAG: DEAD/DEAH box helicase [Bacteroidia bacterium]|nr:DEAD/DEAH box helicase [Bacteroidia bacterium]